MVSIKVGSIPTGGTMRHKSHNTSTNRKVNYHGTHIQD
nr:MAG TPA: hypothetical protein [Caudoviricetes sp.]